MIITVLKLIASAALGVGEWFRLSFIQFYGRLLSMSSQFNLIIIDLRKRKRLSGDHHLGSWSASLINTHHRAVKSGTKTTYVIVPDPFSARLGHASRKRIWPSETTLPIIPPPLKHCLKFLATWHVPTLHHEQTISVRKCIY